MANENIFADFSTQELTDKRDLLRTIIFAVIIIAIIILLFTSSSKILEDYFPISLIFMIGIAVPLYIQFKAITNEIRLRKKKLNLKRNDYFK